MDGTFVLDREMGCTRADFMRWLPGATGHVPVRQEGEELALPAGAGEVRITLRERPPRRIALLELPVLAVRFRFLGLGAPERQAFLARFDAWTRRGGG